MEKCSMKSKKMIVLLTFASLICIGLSGINMVFFGMGLLILGMMLLLCVGNRMTTSPVMGMLIGATFLLAGAGIAILSALEKHGIDTGNWMVLPVCGGLGILFFGLFFFDIYKLLRCSKKIMATYKGCNRYHSTKGPDLYVPIFSYKWDEKTFQASTGFGYTLRKLNKKYTFDEQYPIYLNPHNANIITEKKKLHFWDYFCVIAGLFCLALTICTILG